MPRHPSEEELLRVAAGGVLGPVSPATSTHLRPGCPRCDRRVAQYRAVVASLRAPSLAAVPEPWRNEAQAWLRAREEVFRAAAPQPKRKPGRAVAAAAAALAALPGDAASALSGAVARAREELRAALVLDTASGALLPGVRGVPVATERQILFESPAGQIHLRIESPRPGRFELQGQFLPERAFDCKGASVRVQAGGREITRRLSVNGEFRIAGLAPGEIRLRVDGPGVALACDPLELG